MIIEIIKETIVICPVERGIASGEDQLIIISRHGYAFL